MGKRGRKHRDVPEDAEIRKPKALTDGGSPTESESEADIPQEVREIAEATEEAYRQAERKEALDTGSTSGDGEGEPSERLSPEEAFRQGWDRRTGGPAKSLDEQRQQASFAQGGTESTAEPSEATSQESPAEGEQSRGVTPTESAAELNEKHDGFVTETPNREPRDRKSLFERTSSEDAPIDQSRIRDTASVGEGIEELLSGGGASQVGEPSGVTADGQPMVGSYSRQNPASAPAVDEQQQGTYVAESVGEEVVDITGEVVAEGEPAVTGTGEQTDAETDQQLRNGAQGRTEQNREELFQDLEGDTVVERVTLNDGRQVIQMGGDGRPPEAFSAQGNSTQSIERRIGDRVVTTARQDRFRNLATADAVPEESEISVQQQAETVEEIYGELGINSAEGDVVAVETTVGMEQTAAEFLEREDGITGAYAHEQLDGYIYASASSTGVVASQISEGDDIPHVNKVADGREVAEQVAQFQQSETGSVPTEAEKLAELQNQTETGVAAYQAMRQVDGAGELSDEWFGYPEGSGYIGEQTLTAVDEGISGADVGGFALNRADSIRTVADLSDALEQESGREGQLSLETALNAQDESIEQQIRGIGSETQNVNISDRQVETLADAVRGHREVEQKIADAERKLVSEIAGTEFKAGTRLEAAQKAFEAEGGPSKSSIAKDDLLSRMEQNGDGSLITREFVDGLPDRVQDVDLLTGGEAQELLKENARNGISPERTVDVLASPRGQASVFTSGFDTDGLSVEKQSIGELEPVIIDGDHVCQPTAKVRAEVVNVDSAETLEETGADIFQRVTLRDTETGEETRFTVFTENVEFPDSETYGDYGDMATEGVHYKDGRMGEGDIVTINGAVVNEMDYTHKGNATLAAHVNTDIHIAGEHRAEDAERPVGTTPTVDRGMYAAPGETPRSAQSHRAVERISLSDFDGVSINPEELDFKLTATNVTNDKLVSDDVNISMSREESMGDGL